MINCKRISEFVNETVSCLLQVQKALWIQSWPSIGGEILCFHPRPWEAFLFFLFWVDVEKITAKISSPSLSGTWSFSHFSKEHKHREDNWIMGKITGGELTRLTPHILKDKCALMLSVQHTKVREGKERFTKMSFCFLARSQTGWKRAKPLLHKAGMLGQGLLYLSMHLCQAQ